MGVPEFDDNEFRQRSIAGQRAGAGGLLGAVVRPVPPDCAGHRATGRRERGSIKIGKLNVDNAPNTAQNYGVSSIPTLMIFKDGEVVERFVGVQPKSRLQEAIDSVTG